MSDKNLDDELKRFSESMNDVNNISDMFGNKQSEDIEDHDTLEQSKARDNYFKKKTLVTEVSDDLLDGLSDDDAVILEEMQTLIKAMDDLATKHKRQMVVYATIEKSNHSESEAYGMFINVGTNGFIKLALAALYDLIIERFSIPFFMDSLNTSNKMGAVRINKPTDNDDEE